MSQVNDPGTPNRFMLRMRHLGPALLIYAAYAVGFLFPPDEPGDGFFESAAQVVPVLLLALAVESRWLRLSNLRAIRPRHRSSSLLSKASFVYDRANAAMVMAMPVVGLCYAEWRCLQRLGSAGETSGPVIDFGVRLDARFVTGGVLCGLVGVALLALFGPGPESVRAADPVVQPPDPERDRTA